MAQIILTAQFALLGCVMFTLGMSASAYTCWKLFRRHLQRCSGKPDEHGVTRDDIRSELMRDAFATELMCSEETPEDVARYLYLEAERRARLRKQGVSVEDENDLFSKPHPDPEALQ
ncbi:MAG: hypothetical protein OXF75_04800 [Acidimicrobiaceae bacterium]|nr:hypothetical protein [Acidimicrobiaceae bacterium]